MVGLKPEAVSALEFERHVDIDKSVRGERIQIAKKALQRRLAAKAAGPRAAHHVVDRLAYYAIDECCPHFVIEAYVERELPVVCLVFGIGDQAFK